MSWIYIGLAGVTGVAVLAIAARGRTSAGLDGEPLPMTPLQKRAWIALVCGVLAMIALVAVFALGGLGLYDRNPAIRLSVYALLGVGVLVHSLVVPRTIRGEPRPWADERDLRIFERAPAVQGVAVLLVLAGWTIGLTETYRATGSIPIVFPSLIFMSAFFVHLVSVSVGILIGYRRGLQSA